jgi:site-specific DNA-methyltransferase (adenine-specific)
MGQKWDTGEVAFNPAFWADVLRVLKPGGYVLAFGGTRTYHRLACAIEDGGFEIRDQIGWLYGSGFPKSHDAERGVAVNTCVLVGRHFAGKLPDEHERLADDHVCPMTPESEPWDGWGTALKPAWEPIVMARKPLTGTVAANLAEWGAGAINIDDCRVGFAGEADEAEAKTKNQHAAFGSGPMTNQVFGKFTKDRDDYNPPGRWPANIIHDGSDEVLAAFPHTISRKDVSVKRSSAAEQNGNKGAAFGKESRPAGTVMTSYGDEGSAARFFYCAKASRSDRNDGLGEGKSDHPTVKPTELMRYLCRLVTPPGGTILDPFMGSGSTGRGAVMEGFNFIGIEQDAHYTAIARARVSAVSVSSDDSYRQGIFA